MGALSSKETFSRWINDRNFLAGHALQRLGAEIEAKRHIGPENPLQGTQLFIATLGQLYADPHDPKMESGILAAADGLLTATLTNYSRSVASDPLAVATALGTNINLLIISALTAEQPEVARQRLVRTALDLHDPAHTPMSVLEMAIRNSQSALKPTDARDHFMRVFIDSLYQLGLKTESRRQITTLLGKILATPLNNEQRLTRQVHSQAAMCLSDLRALSNVVDRGGDLTRSFSLTLEAVPQIRAAAKKDLSEVDCQLDEAGLVRDGVLAKSDIPRSLSEKTEAIKAYISGTLKAIAANYIDFAGGVDPDMSEADRINEWGRYLQEQLGLIERDKPRTKVTTGERENLRGLIQRDLVRVARLRDLQDVLNHTRCIEYPATLFRMLLRLNPNGAKVMAELLGDSRVHTAFEKAANRSVVSNSNLSLAWQAIKNGLPQRPKNQLPIRVTENHEVGVKLRVFDDAMAQAVEREGKFGPSSRLRDGRSKKPIAGVESADCVPLLYKAVPNLSENVAVLLKPAQKTQDESKGAITRQAREFIGFFDRFQEEFLEVAPSGPDIAEWFVQALMRSQDESVEYHTVRNLEIVALCCLLVDYQDQHFQLAPQVAAEINTKLVAPFLVNEIIRAGGITDSSVWQILELISPLWSPQTKEEFLDRYMTAVDSQPDLLEHDQWRKICMIFGYQSEFHPDRVGVDVQIAPKIMERTLKLLRGWERAIRRDLPQRLLPLIAGLNIPDPGQAFPDSGGDVPDLSDLPFIRQAIALLLFEKDYKEGDRTAEEIITDIIDERATVYLERLMIIDESLPDPVRAVLDEILRFNRRSMDTMKTDMIEPIREIIREAEGIIGTEDNLADLANLINSALKPVRDILFAQEVAATGNTVQFGVIVEQAFRGIAINSPQLVAERQPISNLGPLEAVLTASVAQGLEVKAADGISRIIDALQTSGAFIEIQALARADADRIQIIDEVIRKMTAKLEQTIGDVSEKRLKMLLHDKLAAFASIARAQNAIREIRTAHELVVTERMKKDAALIRDHQEAISKWLTRMLKDANSPVLTIRRQAWRELRKLDLSARLPLPDIAKILTDMGFDAPDIHPDNGTVKIVYPQPAT